MKPEFNPDELQTLLDLTSDWGFEYGLVADRDKVEAIQLKLQAMIEALKEMET